MNMDRVMATFALAVFAIFVAVPAWRIGRLDLNIALLIGLGLAAWDLYTQLGPRRRR